MSRKDKGHPNSARLVATWIVVVLAVFIGMAGMLALLMGSNLIALAILVGAVLLIRKCVE